MKNLTTNSDESLMRAYLLGENEAFNELYRRHSGRVYSYLKKRLPSREEADEVFQAAFLKAHQSRSGFNPKYSFVQWIYVVTKTCLLDHFRKQGRSVATTEMTEELSQKLGAPTLSTEREFELLERLSPEQRQIVEMRIFDELPYEEISKRVDRTQESVRQTLSRALKKLRLELSEGGTK